MIPPSELPLPLPSRGPRPAGPCPLPDGEDHLQEIHAGLRRLTLRLVRDEATADDLVQEAWVAALGDGRPRVRDLSSWMRRVVRNLASRTHHQTLRRHDVELSTAREAVVDGEPADRHDARELLLGAIEELRSPYREVVRLRYLDELSFAAIARVRGASLNTVKSQARRGREELRRKLTAAGGADRDAWLAALAPLLTGPAASPRPWAPRASTSTATSGSATILWIACTVAGLFLTHRAWSALEIPRTAEVRGEQHEFVRNRAIPAADAKWARSALLPPRRSQAAQASRQAAKKSPATDGKSAPRLRLVTHDREGRATAAIVELWGVERRRLGRFETDAAGTLELELAPEDIDHDRNGTASQGVIVASARAHDGAWSLLHYLPVTGAATRDGVGGLSRPLRIELPGSGQDLHGTVLDDEGHPLAGARVRLASTLSSRRRSAHGIMLADRKQETRTAADGSFRFLDVARQEHHIEAFAPARLPARRTLRNDAPQVEIELQLERGATMAGRVRDASGDPVAFATVRAITELGDDAQRTNADEDGWYELAGLSSGLQRVQASDPQRTLFATEVVGVQNAEWTAWDPHLEPGRSFEVRVHERDGRPVAGAQVIALVQEEPIWSAAESADAAGRVRFAHVPAPPLQLSIKRPGAASQPDVILRIDDLDSLEVTLPAALRETAELQGTLLNHRGEPFRAALVVGCSQVGLFEVRPNADDGSFALRARPGDYAIWAVAEGAGYVDLGEHTLIGDGVTALGTLRAPAPREISWSDVDLTLLAPAPAEQDWVIETGGYCKRLEGLPVLRLQGAPQTLRLLPGDYHLRPAEHPKGLYAPNLRVPAKGACALPLPTPTE